MPHYYNNEEEEEEEVSNSNLVFDKDTDVKLTAAVRRIYYMVISYLS